MQVCQCMALASLVTVGGLTHPAVAKPQQKEMALLLLA